MIAIMSRKLKLESSHFAVTEDASEERHLSKDYRSNNRCRTCRGRHHTSICGSLATHGSSDHHPPSTQTGASPATQSSTRIPVPLPSSSVPTTAHFTLNPSAPAFTPPRISASLCTSSNKVVLLQTALAEISNPGDPTRVLKARIVMDSGSQKSYVTQQVSLPVTLVISTSRLQPLALARDCRNSTT